ncbi:MAG TPA: hypothetical protein HA319_03825 [Nitrosopumilaceae archaeon]|nr:hypothetical protein [Nitrosopumilaceae archaeon]
MEFESISELKKLLAQNYKIEKVEPRMFTSDAEVNIVRVTLASTDGKTKTIKAYREESHALREFIRNLH